MHFTQKTRAKKRYNRRRADKVAERQNRRRERILRRHNRILKKTGRTEKPILRFFRRFYSFLNGK